MRYKFNDKKINIGMVLKKNAVTDSSNNKKNLQYSCEYNKQGVTERLGQTSR